MIHVANRLAITGILQHKSAIVSPTIIESLTGEATYTGLVPTFNAAALPVTVVAPGLGQPVYTGLAPEATSVEIFNLDFTTSQITSIGDTPWRVWYYIYDSSLVLRRTITHDVNRGVTPFTDYVTTHQTFNNFTPFYIDIRVQRMLETTGGSPDNRANDAGEIIWRRDGVDEFISTFRLNQRVTRTNAFSPVDTGTDFEVIIYEG